ncbi:RabGAP/TBC, partial [Diplocarpon rosae]
KRWQITLEHAVSLDSLKRSARVDSEGSLCVSGLRSVCWKAGLTFLLFQTTETTGWSRALVDSRGAYASLREHFLRYIENPDEVGSALDPLDDDRNSPWNTLRQDEEIRAEIFQDVERCMPEEPYFRRPETQTIMLDVLFIFCKINQDVGYRQGMHELLAPILWVVKEDAIEYDRDGDQGPISDSDSLLKQVLDPAYIEHDAFTLLSLVMRSAKSFYELGEPDRRSSTADVSATQQGLSPIVERSRRIHEVYLARLDPELAKHLIDVEILPQIFLMWQRKRSLLDPGYNLTLAVLETNYSFALMLLLKYPPPEAPYGPKTFVDDAIFLRENFSGAGGAKIISKYTGKSPALYSSDSRPLTPLGQALSPGHNLSSAKSQMPSPARFIQQQGGVEAIFQGAANRVFDKAERLGINQAVRDAVDEAKKNMQGLQTSRNNSRGRRSNIMRWSLDEGRSIPNPRACLAELHARNQQLAGMLDQAMTDLRAVSVSPDGDKEKYVQAMDLAIAKVEFVKVYLEDSTMPLPEEPEPAPPSPVPVAAPQPLISPLRLATPQPASESAGQESRLEIAGHSDTDPPSKVDSSLISKALSPTINLRKTSLEPARDLSTTRPKAPVPTRSTIAQSSFSWMLEPDTLSGSSTKSSPPTSPFLKTGRRISGPNREKAAFLFGEDDGEPSRRPFLLGESEEIFNMGSLKVNKDK